MEQCRTTQLPWPGTCLRMFLLVTMVQGAWGRSCSNILRHQVTIISMLYICVKLCVIDYKKWALHNLRLRNVCEGLKNGNDYCYDPAYVSQICSLHPIQLVKTVRLRLDHIKQLIEEENLNLKIIALFRDPRAVRSSRLGRSWCNFPSCNYLPSVCQDQNQDMKDASILAEHHPDKVIIAKYEELATIPKLSIPVILKVSDGLS